MNNFYPCFLEVNFSFWEEVYVFIITFFQNILNHNKNVHIDTLMYSSIEYLCSTFYNTGIVSVPHQ